jgi:hypothetical protein
VTDLILVAGLEFGPEPMAADAIAGWVERLRGADGNDAALRVFAERAAA